MNSLIYKSRRVGRHGKPFWLYKLKTLKDGSDGELFANGRSYTKWGRLLRRAKLDELPQLWNIMRGDMSFVGPRAEEARTAGIAPGYIQDTILSVKPGLTSPAAIHFIDEESILQQAQNDTEVFWTAVKPMKMLLDVWYVQHKGFLLDLALIWTTIRCLITRK